MISQEQVQAAIHDAAYHRYLTFGAVDESLERRLGRPLLYHETQGRLPWPQLRTIRRIERAIAARKGEVITVRMARQTGKNETEAELEARSLSIFRAVPGSTWIRTAPTHKPQLVNSRHRLEKMISNDPLLAGRVRPREGYIYQHGHARIEFLSAQKSASVVGATASIALSVDEAHKVDRGKFEEDFGPFTASTNAPTILWGVAADKIDLLQEYVDHNAGTDRDLSYPASIWCELSPAYAAHYQARLAKLGEDHYVILTQYKLIPVEAIGGYLTPAQRQSLFSGDHPRLEGPQPGRLYYLAIDVGGQSELDLSSEEMREEEPGRDSTMVWVLEVDPDEGDEPYELVRVVAGIWWTGEDHMAKAPEVLKLAQHWGISGGCIDARGVGEALAAFVHREIPAVEAYYATADKVSADCFDLQARINTGRVRFWKGDPAADPELQEIQAQARHTRYEIGGHERMKITKPPGRVDRHIDGIKALTYIHRAVRRPHAGAMNALARMADRARAGQTQEEGGNA